MPWYPSLYGLALLHIDAAASAGASTAAVSRYASMPPDSSLISTRLPTSFDAQEFFTTLKKPEIVIRRPSIPPESLTITIVQTISITLTSTVVSEARTNDSMGTQSEALADVRVPLFTTQDDLQTSTVIERRTSTITATAPSVDSQSRAIVEMPLALLSWMTVIASIDVNRVTSPVVTSNVESLISALLLPTISEFTSSIVTATRASALTSQTVSNAKADTKTFHSSMRESPPTTQFIITSPDNMSTPVSVPTAAEVAAKDSGIAEQSPQVMENRSASWIIVISTMTGIVFVLIVLTVVCCISKHRSRRRCVVGDRSTQGAGLRTPNMEAAIPMQDCINIPDRRPNYPYVGASAETGVNVSRSELNAIRGKPLDSRSVVYEPPFSPFADRRRGTVLPSDSASNLGPYVHELPVLRKQQDPYAYEKSVVSPATDPPLLPHHVEDSILGVKGEVQGEVPLRPVESSTSNLAPPKRRTVLGRASLDTFLSDARGVFREFKGRRG